MFDEGRDERLVEAFGAAFEAMGGTLIGTPPDDPLREVRERLAQAGVVISMVPEIEGSYPLDLSAEPASFADVDVAVIRAAFGIAETGSVAFTERQLGVNTLGYLAQHLIVLLDPADILVNLHHAYRQPELHEARYCVFHTGPSATADIEGVLIHGAQGVRSLSLALIQR